MIQLKQIEIGYQNTLFRIPQLQLEKGGVYILIGKNGAGKSTFLKTLTGESTPKAGNILLQDRPLNEYTTKELARFISFVPSKTHAADFLSVYDFVALGRSPFTSMMGILSPEDKEVINDAIENVGLGDFIHRELISLSDGEKQLASVAKAIAQETEILLLDEPTAFLDYSNRIKMLDLLKDLSKNEGKCIVFSSHDIDICLESGESLILINQSTGELELTDQQIGKDYILKNTF